MESPLKPEVGITLKIKVAPEQVDFVMNKLKDIYDEFGRGGGHLAATEIKFEYDNPFIS